MKYKLFTYQADGVSGPYYAILPAWGQELTLSGPSRVEAISALFAHLRNQLENNEKIISAAPCWSLPFVTEHRVKIEVALDRLWTKKKVECCCGQKHEDINQCIPINWQHRTWHPECAFREALRQLKDFGVS